MSATEPPEEPAAGATETESGQPPRRSCLVDPNDPNDPRVAATRHWMAELILKVRRGEQRLDETTLAGVIYGESTARALISAQHRHSDRAVLCGTIKGTLSLTCPIVGAIVLVGRIIGNLSVRADVRDGITVHGDGIIDGNLDIRARICGFVSVHGKIVGHVFLDQQGEISGGVQVDGEVGGDVTVEGTIGRALYVGMEAQIGGELCLPGSVGYVVMAGRVDGNVAVSGTIGTALSLFGEIGGYLNLSGVSCSGRTILRPRAAMTLGSVNGAQFGGEVHVGGHVSIAQCDFRQCPDLDKFTLVGADLFPDGARQLANPPAGNTDKVSPGEMASIYRQLRTNLEGRGSRATAGIFYRGEMNTRRQAAKESKRWAECAVLSAYRCMSGYGLRAWAATLWFGVLAAAATWWFAHDGLDLDTAVDIVDQASIPEAVLFSVRSMVAFFSPPDAVLSQPDQWVQLGLRFLGPVLIAQAVLAVREHVAR